MKPNRSTEETILERVLTFASPEARLAYLEGACGGDEQLRARVQSLIEAHEAAGGFLADKPAVAVPAPTVEATATVKVPPEESPGMVIGRYKLLQRIGEGGCGVVYMAEQEEPVRRRVALKVIKLGMDSRQVVARFEAERQALALMDHPNIAKVFDAGTSNTGRPFFVMELVKGIRITDYCDQNNLPTRARLLLFVQVCHAIQHAHQKGIIHRDIKPSNILVTLHDGVPMPKVIDFGIAKATEQRLTEKTLFTAFEQIIGTPAYMSPEQAEMSGMDIDTRSDIYALGVLLYELLTGKTPFDAKRLLAAGLDEMRRIIREQEPIRPSTCLSTMLAGEMTVAAKHRQSEPPRLIQLVRGDLDWIVMKALEKDRTRRYETATGLAQDVDRHLNNDLVTARPPSVAYKLQKFARRNKLPVAAAAAITTALVLGVVASTWQAIRATKAERAEIRLRAQAERSRIDAEKARQESERRADAELKAKATAETQTRRTEQALTLMQLQRAEDMFSHGDSAEGLAYLADIVRRDGSNWTAAERLVSALLQRNFPVPIGAPMPHSNYVNSASFSPNGRRIVTTSDDKTARVWDAQTGQPVTEPLEHAERVNSAQFSPDGRWIVTSSFDKMARVWDAQTGQPITQPIKHAESVTSAQFSPDGRWIVTSSSDKTARIWDAQTGQPVTEPFKHGSAVFSAQFSPEGRRIVTAYGQTARVWDIQTGQPGERMRHTNFVFSAAFSPDGRRIATVSVDRTARVWDAQTAQPVTDSLRHADLVMSAQFSPDGRRIVTASLDSTARVWDAQGGQPITEPLKHAAALMSAEFSPDGQRIVTASTDHTARLWDARSGRPLTAPLRHAGAVVSARFSPDGRRVVTASTDKTARVWEARTSQPLSEPMKHAFDIYSARFSPDGQRIAAGWVDFNNSSTAGARVWDVQTGQALIELPKEAQIYSLEFSPDGRSLLSKSQNRTARIWDAKTGQPLTPPIQHTNNVNNVSFAQFSPDGKWIIIGSFGDKTARVWDAKTGQPLATCFPHADGIATARFSSDGRRIVTASDDKTARVWDARTGQPVTEPLKHNDKVVDAQFSPDGRRIATASDDKTARVWDAQTGRPLTEPLKHGSSPNSAQFSPDGGRILTCSGDGAAQVWDAQTGQPLTPPLKHAASVYFAEFSPDGRRVATASADRTARVWDAHSGQPLTDWFEHPAAAFQAAFSPDQTLLLTAAGREVRLWPFVPVHEPVPAWLADWAEITGGLRLGPNRILEPTPTKEWMSLQERVLALAPTNPLVRWAQWSLADRATRPISPFLKVTMTEVLGRRLQENTVSSLSEALLLAPDNGLAWALYGLAILNETNVSAHVDPEWCGRRALLFAPQDPKALLSVATLFKKLGDQKEAQSAVDQALQHDRENPDLWLFKSECLTEAGQHEPALAALNQAIGVSGLSEEKQKQLRLARSSLLRKLLRPSEAQADWLFGKGIPARAPRADTRHIDLGEFYNASPRDDWHNINEIGNNLAPLPTGLQAFGEIEFDVRGIVQLASRQLDHAVKAFFPEYPRQVEAIPVNAKYRCLHFLHGTGWPGTTDTVIGAYILHYEDGSQEKRPIIYGKDVLHWRIWPEMPEAEKHGGTIAWQGAQEHWKDYPGWGIRLYKMTWQTPHPERVIKSLDFVSAMEDPAPFLLAITGEP